MDAKDQKKALSVGLVGNMATVIHQLIDDNIVPDIVTDQTSAHDPLYGYVPEGISVDEAVRLRESDSEGYLKKSVMSIVKHVKGMLKMQELGSIVFDYGNNIREFAKQGGVENAFDFKGFVPEFIRPLFCEGKGPFRWAALSGDPKDIAVTDNALKEAFGNDIPLCSWLNQAQEKIAFQGLPSRICWLGLGERVKAGLIFNNLVREGKISAPLVLGRDHLDCGSVASPYRETEGMKDKSDAVSDWAILNLLLSTSSGATWVSFHHGGGVGIGYSQHAGLVLLLDGTDRAEECLKRTLNNDPAIGVIRHADAGYEKAIEVAKKFDLLI